MTRITADLAFKHGQESAIKSISAIRKHKIADSFFKFVEGEQKEASMHERGVSAGLLNNFAKIMDSEEGQALTNSSDFGPYVMEVWPLVTAWYVDFPLKELISVQDMDKPLAYLFFSVLKAGTSKSPTVAGDVVETATGSRKIHGSYPTGEIYGEQIAASELDFDATEKTTRALLAYAPLNVSSIPGYLKKIKITVSRAAGDADYVALNVIGDEIKLALTTTPNTDSGATLNIQTGLLTIPEDSAATVTTVTGIVANYVWNIDLGKEENLPKVKEQVEKRALEAVPRALMLEWTIFSEYLKKSQFGQDIRTDNTKRILSLIYQFQTRYVLDDMWTYATGNDGQRLTVNIDSSTGVSLEVINSRVQRQLKEIANRIEIESGRIEGNRIVTGRNFKAYLESLPNTMFKPDSQAQNYGFSTPRKIGTYGTFEVYYDPARDADEAMMTYRGSEWYDACYYLGEYMPIVPTDAIALGVTVRSSFCSMEAYCYDKPSCVLKLKFVEK